jgi:hypothetical protein
MTISGSGLQLGQGPLHQVCGAVSRILPTI